MQRSHAWRQRCSSRHSLGNDNPPALTLSIEFGVHRSILKIAFFNNLPCLAGLAHANWILTLREFPCLQAPAEKQQSIAEELDRTPGEVLKKLEDIRNRVL